MNYFICLVVATLNLYTISFRPCAGSVLPLTFDAPISNVCRVQLIDITEVNERQTKKSKLSTVAEFRSSIFWQAKACFYFSWTKGGEYDFWFFWNYLDDDQGSIDVDGVNPWDFGRASRDYRVGCVVIRRNDGGAPRVSWLGLVNHFGIYV
jgi:hypothetical protein